MKFNFPVLEQKHFLAMVDNVWQCSLYCLSVAFWQKSGMQHIVPPLLLMQFSEDKLQRGVGESPDKMKGDFNLHWCRKQARLLPPAGIASVHLTWHFPVSIMEENVFVSLTMGKWAYLHSSIQRIRFNNLFFLPFQIHIYFSPERII